MIEPGKLILLISHKGKRYLRKLETGGEVHTHDGKLLMDEVAEAGFGQYVKTHLGRPYLILKPHPARPYQGRETPDADHVSQGNRVPDDEAGHRPRLHGH